MKRPCFTSSAGLASLLFALTFTGCGKKPEAAAPATASAEKAGTPSAAAPAAAPAKKSIVEHAAKLGFAAHLPKDTELYLGTINLKKHLDAAKKSAFWKEVSAFIDDKTPAPSKAAAPTAEAFKKLGGDDTFIAFGKGAGPSMKTIRQLSELYTEITYRAMIAGGPLGGAGAAGAGMQPDKIIKALIEDPKLLKEAAATIGALQLPPMLIGAKVEKPEDLLKELFPEAKLAEAAKKAKVSDVTTALGGKFKSLEFALANFLTDDMEKQALASLPPTANEETKAAIAKAIDDIQAKKVTFAYGTAGGHVIIAVGMDATHVNFVDKAEASLLAKPDFDKLLPHVDRDLVLLSSIDASVTEPLTTDQPFQPILRGIVSGLKSSEMFRGLATGLEPRLAEMAVTEKKMNKRSFANAVGAGWWDDQGFHMDSFGGVTTEWFDDTKPLQFASLLEDPAIVFGFDYNAKADSLAAARTYFESWMELIHYTAGELVKSGLGGPQGVIMYEMIDKTVLPELVNTYRASKAIDETALGTEKALVADVGGKLGELPGLPPTAADKKTLRLAGVHPVVNREAIGKNWTVMEASLKKLMASIPSPTPIPFPNPMSTEKNGVTTYFLPIPLATEDLLPCASVNDKLFIFGSSKNFNESIAGQLAAAKNADTEPSSMKWKVSFGNVREIIKISSALSASPNAAADIKPALRWIAPFENMRGRCWNEKGVRRDSFTWEIHDVKKFD